MIRDRLELASGERKNQVLADAISKLRLGKNISNLEQAPEYELDFSQAYNLNRLQALTSALEYRHPLIPGEPMSL